MGSGSPSRKRLDGRVYALTLIEEACSSLPGYSLGEVLYTALRRVSRNNGGNIKFLRGIDDDTLIRSIDNCLLNELDENGR